MKRNPSIALSVSIILLFLTSVSISCSKSVYESQSKPRAAIIDQLGGLYPNPVFISGIRTELEKCGYEVNLFSGDDITVDLYRKLPTYGFRFLLFRVHATVPPAEAPYAGRTMLYTNEIYDKHTHLQDQLFERVVPAATEDNATRCFAVSSDYISGFSEGQYDRSIIVMMGCSSLQVPDMAKAFVDRGAAAYVGWSGTVKLNYVDSATLTFINNLCSKKLTIKDALTRTVEENGLDPDYDSYPVLYPYKSGDCMLQPARD